MAATLRRDLWLALNVGVYRGTSFVATTPTSLETPRLPQHLKGTIVALALLLAAYTALVSWFSWVDEKANFVQNLKTITELEARAVDNYFVHLEGDLRDLSAEMTQGGDRIDLDHAYQIVKRYKANHDEVYNVTLIRPDGEILLTAKNAPGTVHVTLANEASFIGYLDDLKAGQTLGIGQPLLAVVSKAVIVPVRIAIRDSAGKLAYILSANLPHEHLRSFWKEAPVTTTAAIGLMRDNGFLLSRYPVPGSLGLEKIYGEPRTGALINHLRTQRFPDSGYVQGPSSLDGPDFLNAFRRLPSYPVTVFVAMPMTEVRAAWMARVQSTYAAVFLLLAGGYAAFKYATRRQMASDLERKRMDEAREAFAQRLRQSEERFRHFFEENSSVQLIMDPISGVIEDANQAAVAYYGYPREQLVGMLISHINTLSPERLAQERLNALHESRNYFQFEHRLASGDLRDVEVHSTPIQSHDGARLLSIIHDVTDRNLAQKRLRQVLDEQKAILNNDLIGIVTTLNRTIVWANPAFEHMLGYQAGELKGVSTRLNYPSDEAYEALGAAAYPVLAAGKVFRSQIEHVRKDGQHIWLDVSGEMLGQGSGQSLWGFVDITARVLGAEKIDTLMRQQKAILNNELVGIMTARERTIEWANPAFETMFGYAPGELVGVPVRNGYCSDEAYETFGKNAYATIALGQSYRTEFEYLRKDGSRFFADVSGSVLSASTGESLWCFIDVTERKRIELEINQLAFYDTLTALPNRRLLLDRLSQAMAANRRSERHGAVMFLDLDNFKSLNDVHGHDVGDLLLLEVADRLKGCVRQIDTVSRFGGDEFVVLLGDLSADKAESMLLAKGIAEKIRTKLAEPYVLPVNAPGWPASTVTHRCSASIGVRVFANNGLGCNEILKSADAAMYQAKDGGRNAVRFCE